jgi:DNA-directed RNA polymerase subunit RPC12/RpoP
MPVIRGTGDARKLRVERGHQDTRKLRCKKCGELAVAMSDGKGGTVQRCTGCGAEYKSTSI